MQQGIERVSSCFINLVFLSWWAKVKKYCENNKEKNEKVGKAPLYNDKRVVSYQETTLLVMSKYIRYCLTICHP
jgi:hypothetical protein